MLTALGDFVYDGNVSGIFKYSGGKITGLRTGAEIPDGVMVIPATLEDGTEIKNIAANAFDGNRNIRKLILGEDIVSVESKAFQWCTNLKEIECASTVTWLGALSFYASGAENVVFKGDISLGNSAFGRVATLKKIVAYGTLTMNGTTPFSYSTDTTPKMGVSYPIAFAKSELGGKVFVWNDMIPLTKSAEFAK